MPGTLPIRRKAMDAGTNLEQIAKLGSLEIKQTGMTSLSMLLPGIAAIVAVLHAADTGKFENSY